VSAARGRRLPALAATLLALGAAGGCGGKEQAATGSAGAAPKDFAGVVAEDVFAGDRAYRAVQLARQVRLGIGLIRQTFDWSAIERRPGRYDFTSYDAFVADTARRDIALLPVLFDPPAFRARTQAPGAPRATAPPRRAADLARFATALVGRYGPRGSFWRAHPRVPRRPIRAWQVWNEPNLPVYWGGRPDAGAYVALLRVVGTAIHRADPGAEVVSAGLPESRLGVPFARYVRAMFRAGAAGAFDVFAINPYAPGAPGVVLALRRARRLLAELGAGTTPIWVTEIGWASGGPRSSFTFGPQGQARRVAQLVDALERERVPLRLRGFVYFNWRDARPYPGGKDFWGLHTGLLSIDGRRKPGYFAFGGATDGGGEGDK